MKASEARAKSFNQVISEIDEIKLQIKKACESKLMCVSVHDLSPAGRESLIADGYKVEQPAASNYNIYIISW